MIVDIISGALAIAGAFFFLAGTAGLIRFPDLYTRLHALTKADNLGLGLIAVSLAIRASSWEIAVKILCIWVLAMVASAVSCHLVARAALKEGISSWRKE